MNLAEAREFVRLTQAEMADRLGISQSNVAQWEAGTRPIPVDRREMVAALLQKDQDWLLLAQGRLPEWAQEMARANPDAVLLVLAQLREQVEEEKDPGAFEVEERRSP